MARHSLLVVQFKVDPDKEDEFNAWYRDYLDTLLPIAPDFLSVRRFVSRDGDRPTYLTIYEMNEGSVEKALAVFDRPDRQSYRREWQEWEHSALHDYSAQIFDQFYPSS